MPEDMPLLDIDSVLSQVSRPARYLGREFNVRPYQDAPPSICLVYPGEYESGATSFPLNLLYFVLAERGVRGLDRSFWPAEDMLKLLDEKNWPLFAWSSRRGLGEFDHLVFVLENEDRQAAVQAVLDRLSRHPGGAKVWLWNCRRETARAFSSRLLGQDVDGAEPGEALYPSAVPFAQGAKAACEAVVSPGDGFVSKISRLVSEVGLETFRVHLTELPSPSAWEEDSRELARLAGRSLAKFEFYFQGRPAPLKMPETRFESRLSCQRWRLRISRTGDMRHLSHLEQIQVIRRAVRRSGLPAALSSSRHKQFKISFGPAVSVGHESLCEYADLETAAPVSSSEIERALSAALPEGFRLLELKKIPLFFPSLEQVLRVVHYRVEGSFSGFPRQSPEEFLSRKEIWIEGKKHQQSPGLREIRRLILSMELESETALKMALRFGPEGHVKPERVLEAWLGEGLAKCGPLKVVRERMLAQTRQGQLLSV